MPVSTRPTLLVGHQHHRLQPAQIAVGAPVLGELHAGAGELAGILLELGLEPLEQREGVGGGAGETGDDVALAEPAHLARIALDDGLAQADLAVAADHHLAALADHQDGGGVKGRTRAAVVTGLAVEIHGDLIDAGLYLGVRRENAKGGGMAGVLIPWRLQRQRPPVKRDLRSRHIE